MSLKKISWCLSKQIRKLYINNLILHEIIRKIILDPMHLLEMLQGTIFNSLICGNITNLVVKKSDHYHVLIQELSSKRKCLFVAVLLLCVS